MSEFNRRSPAGQGDTLLYLKIAEAWHILCVSGYVAKISFIEILSKLQKIMAVLRAENGLLVGNGLVLQTQRQWK